MHEWMVDNGFTPHIVATADGEGLRIPKEHVRDGRIVFNVSYAATRGLTLGNDVISFEARFNGVPRQITVPIDAVLGIYARETGQGMIFSDEEQSASPRPDGADDPAGNAADGGVKSSVKGDGDEKKSAKPTLTIVK
jgi:stringent starvation protein B